jgi:polar amino acid transport system substrate-binding protein
MARLVGFRKIRCVTIAVVLMLSEQASAAEPLRFVTDIRFSQFGDLGDDKAPGLALEVYPRVFAAMGKDVSFEEFPTNRAWMMVLRGERDGMFPTYRTSEREQICSFPDEALIRNRWVLFVRTADVGKLKFSSLDDLVGHDVAVRESIASLFQEPTGSPDLWKFLGERHNMVEANSSAEAWSMLAAGRVDYVAEDLGFGMYLIAKMGLSGKIEPLLARSVMEKVGLYVCFSKARVSAALVDAFSRALKEFKQTEAYQAIYRKYFP